MDESTSSWMIIFAYVSFCVGGVLVVGAFVYLILWVCCKKCNVCKSCQRKPKSRNRKSVGHAKYMDNTLSGTKAARAQDDDTDSLNYEGHTFLPSGSTKEKESKADTTVHVENEVDSSKNGHTKIENGENFVNERDADYSEEAKRHSKISNISQSSRNNHGDVERMAGTSAIPVVVGTSAIVSEVMEEENYRSSKQSEAHDHEYDMHGEQHDVSKTDWSDSTHTSVRESVHTDRISQHSNNIGDENELLVHQSAVAIVASEPYIHNRVSSHSGHSNSNRESFVLESTAATVASEPDLLKEATQADQSFSARQSLISNNVGRNSRISGEFDRVSTSNVNEDYRQSNQSFKDIDQGSLAQESYVVEEIGFNHGSTMDLHSESHHSEINEIEKREEVNLSGMSAVMVTQMNTRNSYDSHSSSVKRNSLNQEMPESSVIGLQHETLNTDHDTKFIPAPEHEEDQRLLQQLDEIDQSDTVRGTHEGVHDFDIENTNNENPSINGEELDQRFSYTKEHPEAMYEEGASSSRELDRNTNDYKEDIIEDVAVAAVVSAPVAMAIKDNSRTQKEIEDGSEFEEHGRSSVNQVIVAESTSTVFAASPLLEKEDHSRPTSDVMDTREIIASTDDEVQEKQKSKKSKKETVILNKNEKKVIEKEYKKKSKKKKSKKEVQILNKNEKKVIEKEYKSKKKVNSFADVNNENNNSGSSDNFDVQPVEATIVAAGVTKSIREDDHSGSEMFDEKKTKKVKRRGVLLRKDKVASVERDEVSKLQKSEDDIHDNDASRHSSNSKKEKKSSWFGFRRSKNKDKIEKSSIHEHETQMISAATVATVAASSAAHVSAHDESEQSGKDHGAEYEHEMFHSQQTNQEEIQTIVPSNETHVQSSHERYLSPEDASPDADSLIIAESPGPQARSSPRPVHEEESNPAASDHSTNGSEQLVYKDDEGYQTHDSSAHGAEANFDGNDSYDKDNKGNNVDQNEGYIATEDSREYSEMIPENGDEMSESRLIEESPYSANVVHGHVVEDFRSENADHDLEENQQENHPYSTNVIHSHDAEDYKSENADHDLEDNQQENHPYSTNVVHSHDADHYLEDNQHEYENIEQDTASLVSANQISDKFDSESTRVSEVINQHVPSTSQSENVYNSIIQNDNDDVPHEEKTGFVSHISEIQAMQPSDDQNSEVDIPMSTSILADIRAKRGLKQSTEWQPINTTNAAEKDDENLFEELHTVLKSKKPDERESAEIAYNIDEKKYAEQRKNPNDHLDEGYDISAFNVKDRASIFEQITEKTGEKVIPTYGSPFPRRAALSNKASVAHPGVDISHPDRGSAVNVDHQKNDVDSEMDRHSTPKDSDQVTGDDTASFAQYHAGEVIHKEDFRESSISLNIDDSYDEPVDAIETYRQEGLEHSSHIIPTETNVEIVGLA